MQLPIREDRNASSKTRASRRRPDALGGIERLRAPVARNATEKLQSGAPRTRHSRNMSSVTSESYKTHRHRHRHRHSRKDGKRTPKVDSERRHRHRHRHRTKNAESDSENDYVYPHERRRSVDTRQRYEEVRVLGRHGKENDTHADGLEDGMNNVKDERRRSSRPSGTHHHRHHHHHRGEAERSREHRPHRARTEEKERDRDAKRIERRAAREDEHARNSPPASKARREHRVKPNTGFWAKLLGKM